MYDQQAQQMGYGTANTSGQGAAATVPAEIQGLNWGGLMLSWIWGIGNSTWIALLSFVPFIGVFVPFYLLFKGNELAWKNKQWAIAGLVILVIAVVLGVLGSVIGAAAGTAANQ